MRTTVAAAVAALALGLAGCSDSGQPSPPPTQDQPTTTSSPADTSPTTKAAPTTEAPSETASTNLPPEATEDSEAGAEAFALHYIELINQTGQNPEPGVLEPLSEETCKTCKNFEENVEYLIANELHNDGPAARVHSVNAVNLGATTNVELTFDQLQVNVVDGAGDVAHSYELEENVTFVFRLRYQDGWLIEEIRVAE